MDFVDLDGENAIEAWFSELVADAEEHINGKLWTMATHERAQWPTKWMGKYKTSDSIFEVRCPFKKIQYRPLGYFGPGRQQFTLLAGAIEIGDKIEKAIIAKAEARKSIVEGDRNRVCKHYFVQEQFH